MSELILYIEVIKKLGFKVIKSDEGHHSWSLAGDIRKNLHPLFSRSGVIEFGFHKELSDDEYWKTKLQENTYEIWVSDKSLTHKINRYGKSVSNLNNKDEQHFIIIGHNSNNDVTYLETIEPDVNIRSSEMDKETFYKYYQHLFRNIKIDTLT